ncbi:MAG TPA: hypothetical protein VNZ27_06450 [Rhodanobacter sp.]|jgi:hypothetical protein|nr:hypothetical protein [Rhodanobacter sp.]
MAPPNLHEVAIGYLLAHQAEHLSPERHLLVARCADHLQNYGVSTDTATVITLQAFGEIHARGNSAHVDLTKTTSYAVFVVDPVSKQGAFFSAADLVRIAREQAVQLAAHVATKH